MMKFEYKANEENLKKTVLIAPSLWEEFRYIKLKKNLNVINTKEKKDLNAYFHMAGETFISELFSNELIDDLSETYEKAFKLILSDYRWVMLSERRWINSSTFYIGKIRELVIGCCNYIFKKKLKYLFSGGVPHSIETWILATILEKIFLGEVYIFEISSLPGYTSIFKSMDEHHQLELDSRFKLTDVSSDKYSLEAGSGDLRLVIQGKSSDLESLRQRAIHLLRTNAEDFIDPRGIVLRTGAKLNNSSLAFVYPGFGNLYPNMGKGLLNQFPGLLSRIR